jgi:hypothetical protein
MGRVTGSKSLRILITVTAYRVPSSIPIYLGRKYRSLSVDKDEYRVVWSGPHGEGEYTTLGAHAALGYGYQSVAMGADEIKVIHDGVELSLDEFDKKLARL